MLCLGISSQRGTFITWDSVTKRPFHNFITWKDTRANFDIMKWNKSIFFKVILLWIIYNNLILIKLISLVYVDTEILLLLFIFSKWKFEIFNCQFIKIYHIAGIFSLFLRVFDLHLFVI